MIRTNQTSSDQPGRRSPPLRPAGRYQNYSNQNGYNRPYERYVFTIVSRTLLILNLGAARHLRLLQTSFVTKFHRHQEMATRVIACHMEGHRLIHQVMEMHRIVREGPQCHQSAGLLEIVWEGEITEEDTGHDHEEE
jgi:hypothetical protein